MLGREEDAQEAYKEAALVSEGVAAGSFAKALASLKAYDEDLVAKMEEAVRFLQLERGESHKISYSIQRCHSSATIEDGDCAPLRLDYCHSTSAKSVMILSMPLGGHVTPGEPNQGGF